MMEMKNGSNKVVFIGLLMLMTGCGFTSLGEPSKPLHFYTIDPVSDQENQANNSDQQTAPGNGPAITVDAIEGAGIYSETPIVWRDKQHLQRFKYNRWESPPARMLQDVIVHLLRQHAGSSVAWIHADTSDFKKSRFVVRGTLRNLYLQRSDDRWKIRLTLNLLLVKRPEENRIGLESVSSGDILGTWTLRASGRTSAPEQEQDTPSAMNALLEDLNRQISRNGERIAQEIIDRVGNAADSTPDVKEQENENASEDNQ